MESYQKKGAYAVAKGIWDNNRLLKINLAWNGFSNEGAEILGKALAHNLVLEELDLRCNRIGPTGFASLCLCFKDNNSLKKLMVKNITFLRHNFKHKSTIYEKKRLVETTSTQSLLKQY